MLVGIASTEDPGQIAPLEAVGSGFTLFVEAFFGGYAMVFEILDV